MIHLNGLWMTLETMTTPYPFSFAHVPFVQVVLLVLLLPSHQKDEILYSSVAVS